MEKIKVYLQYPWKFPDSQYYKSIIEFPPKGIEYIVERKKHGMITNERKMFFLNFLKKLIRRNLRRIKITLLNIHKTPEDMEYDLIHCAHCLSSNNSPWVADFESVWQMLITDHETTKGLKKASEVLQRKNCKKIIAWTEEAKKDIITKFPEIKDKVEIVSYAIKAPNFKKIENKNIRLLFMGRYFIGKGGLHVVEAFDRLTKKFSNVEATIVGKIPSRVRKKYSENTQVKFYDLLPYEKIINEIYPSSDIYVSPGYSDTFGFPFVEALAFGLPVVTVGVHSREELISNNKTGFVIPVGNEKIDQGVIDPEGEKIIQEIVKKTSQLIENNSLREKMSKNGLEEVRHGKFSIKERNKKLERIYSEAIK